MNRKRILATALAAVFFCGGITLPLRVCGMNASASEFILYSDKSSDTEGVKAFVSRMYDVCLGREPDELGLNGWTDQLVNREATGCSVAYGFVFSPEFIGMNPSNSEFVNCMYAAFFGREADSEGFKYWVDFLDNGVDKEEVFAGFANSQEFSNLCKKYGVVKGYYVQGQDFNQTAKVNLFVDRLYNIILDRECDEDGMAGWTNKLMNKEESGCSVAYGFVFSPEFLTRHACNECYVEALYKAFLGRASDSEGKASWVSKLNEGISREEVFAGFAGSIEFADICADYGIDAGRIEGISGSTHQEGTCTICGSSENGNDPTTPSEGNKDNGSSSGTPSTTPSGSSNGNSTGNSSGNLTGNSGNTPSGTPNGSDNTTATPEPTSEPTPSAVSGRKKVKVEKIEIPNSDVNDLKINDDYTIDFPSNGSGFYRVEYPDGRRECYLLDENGNIIIGEATVIIIDDGNVANVMKCHFDEETGKAYSGWKKLDGKEYYFTEFGNYIRDYYAIKNGKVVFLDRYGQMVYGWYEGPTGDYYADPETGELATGLTCINGIYYYFDDWHKKQTGWLLYNGDMLYFNLAGELRLGWQTIDGAKYYFEFGACKGFTKIDGLLYYFDDTYKLCTGRMEIDGQQYYFSKDGAVRAGLIEGFGSDKGKIFCVDDEGKLVSGLYYDEVRNNFYYFDKYDYEITDGWIQIDGYTYYFNPSNHAMYKYAKNVDGKNYYFGEDGRMVKNTVINIDRLVSGSVVHDYYYYGEDGSMQSGWIEYYGKWHYHDKETGLRQYGWLKDGSDWYYLDSATGGAPVSGWFEVDFVWYYFDATSYKMQTGWVQDGSNWYYMDLKDGFMCKNKWIQDKNGVDWYYVGSDGKMLRNTSIVDGGKTYYFGDDGKML